MKILSVEIMRDHQLNYTKQTTGRDTKKKLKEKKKEYITTQRNGKRKRYEKVKKSTK
jgi:hypothetical protein